tara:strand:- start:230 stop:502 length:273 start_codon:yes stop_codon:yes gene_type:complete
MYSIKDKDTEDFYTFKSICLLIEKERYNQGEPSVKPILKREMFGKVWAWANDYAQHWSMDFTDVVCNPYPTTKFKSLEWCHKTKKEVTDV